MAEIHPTAVVDKSAEIADGTIIGPYAIIGANVTIGAGSRVGPFCVIEGWTEIGEGNRIGTGSCLGGWPHHVKYKGEKSFLKIGNNNFFAEYVTLHRGSSEGAITRIGDRNFIMTYCHISATASS